MNLPTQNTGTLAANGGAVNLSWTIDPVALGLAAGVHNIVVGGMTIQLTVRAPVAHVTITVDHDTVVKMDGATLGTTSGGTLGPIDIPVGAHTFTVGALGGLITPAAQSYTFALDESHSLVFDYQPLLGLVIDAGSLSKATAYPGDAVAINATVRSTAGEVANYGATAFRVYVKGALFQTVSLNNVAPNTPLVLTLNAYTVVAGDAGTQVPVRLLTSTGAELILYLTVPSVANIALSNLVISDNDIFLGQTTVITVTATNTGGTPGSQSVTPTIT